LVSPPADRLLLLAAATPSAEAEVAKTDDEAKTSARTQELAGHRAPMSSGGQKPSLKMQTHKVVGVLTGGAEILVGMRTAPRHTSTTGHLAVSAATAEPPPRHNRAPSTD